ncbi:unnamed protein product [Calypogeia fissa]
MARTCHHTEGIGAPDQSLRVINGPTEKEQLDVQGDITYDIVDFITETSPNVPESAIYIIEDGRKRTTNIWIEVWEEEAITEALGEHRAT